MKKVTIKKGCHRPFRFPVFYRGFGSLFNDACIEYNIKFDEDCRYTLTPHSDQADWNKLFGFCYGLLGIHKNSVRYGYSYDDVSGLIQICAIVYSTNSQGKVSVRRQFLFNVRIGEEHKYSINSKWTGSNVEVELMFDDYIVFKTHLFLETYTCDMPLMRFGCGLYFGGNQRAPQKITIYEDYETHYNNNQN